MTLRAAGSILGWSEDMIDLIEKWDDSKYLGQGKDLLVPTVGAKFSYRRLNWCLNEIG